MSMASEEYERFAGFLESVLSLEADEVADLFSLSATFAFGSGRAVRGRSAIRRGFVQLFSQTACIRHELVSFWASSGVVVADADLSFEFDNGATVTIPATTSLWFLGSVIQHGRILFYPEPALNPVVDAFADASFRHAVAPWQGAPVARRGAKVHTPGFTL